MLRPRRAHKPRAARAHEDGPPPPLDDSEDGIPPGLRVEPLEGPLDDRVVITPYIPKPVRYVSNMPLIPALTHNKQYRRWVKKRCVQYLPLTACNRHSPTITAGNRT